MKEFFKSKWFKFSLATIIVVLWIIWIGNFWLFLGLPIVYDWYISKKVNWTFWKKRLTPEEKASNKVVRKNSKLVEWIDALIFAVVAASLIRLFFIEAFTIPTSSMEKSLLVGDYLFVSKVSYGPKMPNTPLSFPFAHHTLPLTTTTKSYLEWISFPYKRIAGFGEVKNDDVVVFNYPDGDTVALNQQAQSYYQLCRDYGRKNVWNNDFVNPYTGEILKDFFGEVVSRPVDKRENYIKRCVAIHGDSLQIIHGKVFINGVAQQNIENLQYKYFVAVEKTLLPQKNLLEMGISIEDQKAAHSFSQAMVEFILQDSTLRPLVKFDNNRPVLDNIFILPLTNEMVEKMRASVAIKAVVQFENLPGARNESIFPHNEAFNWNEDNFGPLWIPQKDATIKLTVENLPLYSRAIETYEGNELLVTDNKTIYINGEVATTYTFKMDYYFMMGDSRHNSADSRFWGFVPEDHVVGKAVFVWLSLDKDFGFPKNLRFSRMFRLID